METKTRKNGGRKTGALPIIFYLLFLIFCVTCEQPSGVGDRPDLPADNGGDEENDIEGGDYVPQIIGVVIASYPNTIYFAKGQPFSSEGLELKFVYDNAEYGRALSSGEYEVEAIDTEALAPPRDVRTKPVAVTIKQTEEGEFPPLSYSIKIDSSTSILRNITMTTPPAKTVYTLGEEFSLAGIVMTGTYQGGDRNGQTATVSGTAAVSGYNKYRRGPQTVTLKLNGTPVGTADVRVKLAPGTAITLNRLGTGWQDSNQQAKFYRPVWVKNAPFKAAHSSLQAAVQAGGQSLLLNYGNGGITDGDVKGYNPSVTGTQTLTLDLDGNTATFKVYVADVEPEVWFDYGYRRVKNPDATGEDGSGPGAGAYYAKEGETLVLSPVRFLIGYKQDEANVQDYNAGRKDAGATYEWSVSGGNYTTSANGEFCYFTPAATGNYTVTVKVTGWSDVTECNITKTASTPVVCYTGTVAQPAGKTYTNPTKHFAPGQHNEGAGWGWSLGMALGYEMWYLPGGANPLMIGGNAFSGWAEAGIVWVQYDANGNGYPDETWYELKGSDDDDPSGKNLITRRYAVTYIRAPDPPYYVKRGDAYYYNASLDTDGEGLWAGSVDGDNRHRNIYWVDSKGRMGRMAGWPYGNGVSDDPHTRLTLTGTLLRDDGLIACGGYNSPALGYVDTAGNSEKWPLGYYNVARDAIRADGSPANLNPALVRFVKVQTAYFSYGGLYGNVSTEIVSATGLPNQANGFPMPWD